LEERKRRRKRRRRRSRRRRSSSSSSSRRRRRRRRRRKQSPEPTVVRACHQCCLPVQFNKTKASPTAQSCSSFSATRFFPLDHSQYQY